MPDIDLVFSPSSTNEAGSYKLIELTPELTRLFEDAIHNEQDLLLNIKGQSDEDAVLCTSEKTYAMRSVNLSNSVVVVRPLAESQALDYPPETAAICDQLHEIIELHPAVPRLHKLTALVRDRVYDETQEDESNDIDDDATKRFTYSDAKEQIQASDAELDRGLKERRILIINNELRPISIPYLNRLLELILNLLVSLGLKHTAASVDVLLDTLADEHEVLRTVSEQVMTWFGHIKDGKWHMDVDNVVREMGLGILRNHRHEPINLDELLARWKASVGDTFESAVSPTLLLGNYLQLEGPEAEVSLKYFPSSDLPFEPAPRFAELFLSQSKWKGEEIAPFLVDLAVDSKERDKLLLKYCRAVNDGQGIRYMARAQYNG